MFKQCSSELAFLSGPDIYKLITFLLYSRLTGWDEASGSSSHRICTTNSQYPTRKCFCRWQKAGGIRKRQHRGRANGTELCLPPSLPASCAECWGGTRVPRSVNSFHKAPRLRVGGSVAQLQTPAWFAFPGTGAGTDAGVSVPTLPVPTRSPSIQVQL